jgi:hypothetical protein
MPSKVGEEIQSNLDGKANNIRDIPTTPIGYKDGPVPDTEPPLSLQGMIDETWVYLETTWKTKQGFPAGWVIITDVGEYVGAHWNYDINMPQSDMLILEQIRQYPIAGFMAFVWSTAYPPLVEIDGDYLLLLFSVKGEGECFIVAHTEGDKLVMNQEPFNVLDNLFLPQSRKEALSG